MVQEKRYNFSEAFFAGKMQRCTLIMTPDMKRCSVLYEQGGYICKAGQASVVEGGVAVLILSLRQ
jgi:hypothetical protein